MMQIFNLFSCRLTFEDEVVLTKAWNLFKNMFKVDATVVRNHNVKFMPKRAIKVGRQKISHQKSLAPDLKYIQMKIQDDERKGNARYFWFFLALLLMLQVFIVQKGSQFGFIMAPLSWQEYLLSFVIGYGILVQ